MIHRRVAEAQRGAEETRRLNLLTEGVIGAAIEVHRLLGPGLLESVYQECLCHELCLRHIPHERQVAIGASYKDHPLAVAFRADLLVDQQVMVELKAVESLLDVHTAQLLTYLKVTNLPLGLLINFNIPVLWKGVKRVANRL